MHIAVCMDVAADRKQLERLLNRSADRRLAQDNSVPFYIQSYGNKAALFARPHMYDLFFIDILHDNMDSVQIIHQLRLLGVTANICYCPSKEDLSDSIEEVSNVMILKQPIVAAELEKIMDIAVAEVKSRVPVLDLHSVTDTIHMEEKDFLYAEKKSGTSLVHMTDGRCVESGENISLFYERARATYSEVYFIAGNLVCTKAAMKETGFSSLTLVDGNRFRVGHRIAKQIKENLLDDNSETSD